MGKTIQVFACAALTALAGASLSAEAYAGGGAKKDIVEPQFSAEILNQIGIDANAEIAAEFGNDGKEATVVKALMYFKNIQQRSLAEKDGEYTLVRTNNETLRFKEAQLLEAYRIERVIQSIHQRVKNYADNKGIGGVLDEIQWAANYVGDGNSRIGILYCSGLEYIAVYGSSIAITGAYSGVYASMKVYDIMFAGEMVSTELIPSAEYDIKAGERSSKPRVTPFTIPGTYGPGTYSVLERNEIRTFSMTDFTYMIDYGVGGISKNFGQGIITPTLLSRDTVSMKNQLRSCVDSYFSRLKYKFKRHH